MLIRPYFLKFVVKSRHVLAEKVGLSNKVQDVAKTAKTTLFRDKFDLLRKLSKCSIVV